MDYESLNLEYRQAIIKVVRLLLTEITNQEKEPEEGICEENTKAIIEETNRMLDLPIPDKPTEKLTSEAFGHYRACLQLSLVIAKLKIRRYGHIIRKWWISPRGNYDSQPSLTELWEDSTVALAEADYILPNPLTKPPVTSRAEP